MKPYDAEISVYLYCARMSVTSLSDPAPVVTSSENQWIFAVLEQVVTQLAVVLQNFVAHLIHAEHGGLPS